jgi:hypothetical protein
VFDTERERDQFVIEAGGRGLSERDVKVIIGCGNWVADENGIVDNAAEDPRQNRDDVILLYVDKFNEFAVKKNISLRHNIPSYKNINDIDILFGTAEVRHFLDDAVRIRNMGKRFQNKWR